MDSTIKLVQEIVIKMKNFPFFQITVKQDITVAHLFKNNGMLFFSAYCDIMMAATYRKLLVYLLLKPPITVNETTKM